VGAYNGGLGAEPPAGSRAVNDLRTTLFHSILRNLSTQADWWP